jgi:hypothetical protein
VIRYRKILEILRQAGIDRVSAPYFLQWRILFESQERVIASSEGMSPGLNRYSAFEAEVARVPRRAAVLHVEAAVDATFGDPRAFVPVPAGDYVVYLPRAKESGFSSESR